MNVYKKKRKNIFEIVESGIILFICALNESYDNYIYYRIIVYYSTLRYTIVSTQGDQENFKTEIWLNRTQNIFDQK